MKILTVQSLTKTSTFGTFLKTLITCFMQKIFSKFWILLEFNLHRK